MALLSNSSYTILLKQKTSVIDTVEKTFRLSQTEKDTLLTADKGEGIFIYETEHSEIKITASEEEDKIITTNPDVLAEREARQIKPIKIPPSHPEEEKEIKENSILNLEKRYFKKSELDRKSVV